MLNNRQKKSLSKYFRNSAISCIAVAVIGNSIKSDIPVINTVVILVIAVVFTVLGLLVLRNVGE